MPCRSRWRPRPARSPRAPPARRRGWLASIDATSIALQTAGHSTSTSASACSPNRVSPTVTSAATRRRRPHPRPPAGPAGRDAEAAAARAGRGPEAHDGLAVRLEARLAGGRLVPPVGDDEPHARGFLAAERVRDRDLDLERLARAHRRAVGLDPRGEPLGAEAGVRQQLAVELGEAPAVVEPLLEVVLRHPPRRPVAADEDVRPEREAQLGAPDVVVDPEAVAVLVVQERPGLVERVVVAGGEDPPAVD